MYDYSLTIIEQYLLMNENINSLAIYGFISEKLITYFF